MKTDTARKPAVLLWASVNNAVYIRPAATMAKKQIVERSALAAATLALSFVPLVGTLGYFSALLLAPILSLIGTAEGLRLGRRVATQERDEPQGTISSSFVEVSRRYIGAWAWLVGIPFSVLGLSALWNPNCDFFGGLAWFAIGPAASSLLGYGWGLASGLLIRRRIQTWAAFTPFFVCLGIGLFRLYVHPVVYAYDPFWGFFSGPIYDENVGITSTYLWFRFYNLTFGLSAIAAVSAIASIQQGSKFLSTRVAGSGLALIACTWFGCNGDRFGFTSTTASIREHLSLTHKTPHFEIYYAPRSETARDIETIAIEHEFAWERLESLLGRTPDAPIQSFIFPGVTAKKKLFGAGRVEVSLPWKRQIYLRHQSFPHRSLHHELAHSFGGAFGDPIFGLSPSVGLIEGLATSLAPRSSFGLDLHDQAAILDRLEKRPRLSQIMGLGFWGQASSRAYTAVGSFSSWLVLEFGVEKLIELYGKGAAFEEVYGRPLSSLEKDWVGFLRSRVLEDRDVTAMAQRFKRPALFKRVCAYRAAELRAQAHNHVSRGQYDLAIERLSTLCDIEPGQYRHRLELARTQLENGNYLGAAESLEAAASLDSLTATATAEILEDQGDLALLQGELESASNYYTRAMLQPLGDSAHRVLQIKRIVDTSPQLASKLVGYFSVGDKLGRGYDQAIARLHIAHELAQNIDHKAMGHYLVGLQLMQIDAVAHALPHFVAAVDARTLSPRFERASYLNLLSAAIRSGDFELADSRLEDFRGAQQLQHRSGHIADLEMWTARLAFYRAHH